MREIKFRAWDEGNKVMHDDFRYIKSGEDGNEWRVFISDKQPRVKENERNQLVDEPNPYFQQQLKIMQWTGLLDKNGIDIYEGDIVSSQDDEGDYATYKDIIQVVEFDTGSFYPVSEKYSKYFEVIGNIYENKELLND